MTDIIIAYRVNGGKVQFLLDEEGDVAIFTDMKHVDHYVEHNALFRSGQTTLQIIELDEI
jgi:hypothetical protein